MVCSYECGGTANFGIEHAHDVDADADVAGYFQLSDLAQFAALRTVLPELQRETSVEIIERLRSDDLHWYIGNLKKWRARRYQREAEEHGFEFTIVV
jgi:hypothetical protein